MIKNFETIKQYVITLGDLEDTPELNLLVQALISECLAYCYRDDVPACMELPLANVIASEIKKRDLLGVDGDISSYREGDMQITLSAVNTATGKVYYGGKLDAFKQIIGVVKNV